MQFNPIMAVSDQSGTKALAQGLRLLSIIGESQVPLRGAEIAERSGLHPSTVSRALKALCAAGYVCKPDYHHFRLSLGSCSLATRASEQIPEINDSRELMRSVAAELPSELRLSLATIHDEQLLHLNVCHRGQDPLTLSSDSYPLHLSSPGLILCSLRDHDEALALLEASRQRYGWARPGSAVPDSPAALLAQLPTFP